MLKAWATVLEYHVGAERYERGRQKEIMPGPIDETEAIQQHESSDNQE
jgi:hypothetical protein